MPPSRAKQRQAGFLPVVKYLDTLITGLLSCRATYCTHIGIHLGYSCLVQNTGQEAVMLILCVVTGCLSPTGTFCLFLVLLNMANGVKSQILSSLWILASHIWSSFFSCRHILLNAYIYTTYSIAFLTLKIHLKGIMQCPPLSTCSLSVHLCERCPRWSVFLSFTFNQCLVSSCSCIFLFISCIAYFCFICLQWTFLFKISCVGVCALVLEFLSINLGVGR